MSQEPKRDGDTPQGDLPSYLPEEMIPLYDWYQRRGSQVLTLLSVAVVIAAGVIFLLRHRENRGLEASAALAAAESSESLESLNAKYGKSKVGPVIRIRLAKAHYDAGRYEEAQKVYEEFLRRDGKHDLADIARLGRGAALEARQQFAEALKVYADFEESNPGHYLLPSAVMGRARCLAAQERKSEALDLLERLAVSRSDTPWETMARDLIGVIQRFEGFKAQSLFDQLDAASKALPTPAADPAAGATTVTIPIPSTNGASPTAAPPLAATVAAPAAHPAAAPPASATGE